MFLCFGAFALVPHREKSVLVPPLFTRSVKPPYGKKFAHTLMIYNTERIQYSAPLAVSGAWRGTEIDSLYKELGWENSYYHRCDLANIWTMAIFM